MWCLACSSAETATDAGSLDAVGLFDLSGGAKDAGAGQSEVLDGGAPQEDTPEPDTGPLDVVAPVDRKSTRLNSSHT